MEWFTTKCWQEKPHGELKLKKTWQNSLFLSQSRIYCLHPSANHLKPSSSGLWLLISMIEWAHSNFKDSNSLAINPISQSISTQLKTPFMMEETTTSEEMKQSKPKGMKLHLPKTQSIHLIIWKDWLSCKVSNVKIITSAYPKLQLLSLQTKPSISSQLPIKLSTTPKH